MKIKKIQLWSFFYRSFFVSDSFVFLVSSLSIWFCFVYISNMVLIVLIAVFFIIFLVCFFLLIFSLDILFYLVFFSRFSTYFLIVFFNLFFLLIFSISILFHLFFNPILVLIFLITFFYPFYFIYRRSPSLFSFINFYTRFGPPCFDYYWFSF